MEENALSEISSLTLPVTPQETELRTETQVASDKMMSTLFCFPCSKERWLPPPGLPAPLKFLVPLGLRNKLNSLTNPMAKALLIIFRSTFCSGNFDFTQLLHFPIANACVLSLPKRDRAAVTNWSSGCWHLSDFKFQRLFAFTLWVQACSG